MRETRYRTSLSRRCNVPSVLTSQINVYPINNSGPGPQAQLMSVELVGSVINASSGLYRFKFPLIGVGAYVRGPPAAGRGLNAQNFSTEFTVTEVALGVFTITYPFSTFALTSSTTAETRITLQPLSAGNALQQWRFVPVNV